MKQHITKMNEHVNKLTTTKKYCFSTISLACTAVLYTPMSYTAQSPSNEILISASAASAISTLEIIEVEGLSRNHIGEAISASDGIVGQHELLSRPMLRTGDLLESVPGMVVTQHSGTGKANQYFLRGFNLDHGTDFASSINGMPINMRTHGHGQGYTDLNFIIPETIQSLRYNKGAYRAGVGDFSGAGSAEFTSESNIQASQIALSLGEFGYQRALLTSNVVWAVNGSVLANAPSSLDSKNAKVLNYALEVNRYDGPWTDIEEDLKKYNIFAQYKQALGNGDIRIGLMAYENSWNSADQIPLRAVQANLIDEFGSLDKTVGGQSSRSSINIQWQNEHVSASFYTIDYALNLWSNFTYFLDNPVTGDQFEQVDDRIIMGGQISLFDYTKWQGRDVMNTLGIQVRIDDIDEVGLYSTNERARLGVIRSDAVQENSVGLFWENEIRWSSKLKTILGARYDYFEFDVDSLVGTNINNIDLSSNSGRENDRNVSLKGSAVYTVNEQFEVYASMGEGFHSNDARGTIEQIDPSSGEQVLSVDPLVDSIGYELGFRASINEALNLSVAIWGLKLDSELLFVGDAGNTEASFASSRKGLEVTAYYRMTNEWTLDVEYALSDAQFSNLAPTENEIPGAIANVLQAGINYQQAQGWFGTARLRYFGERPLNEDNSQTSKSTTIVNMNAGYRFVSGLTLTLDMLNALDSNDHDIDYFYASRLANEPAGAAVEDLHYHVLAPRNLRLTASYSF